MNKQITEWWQLDSNPRLCVILNAVQIGGTYIVKWDTTKHPDEDMVRHSLWRLGQQTGALVKFLKTKLHMDGKTMTRYYEVSDPLMHLLEQAGLKRTK